MDFITFENNTDEIFQLKTSNSPFDRLFIHLFFSGIDFSSSKASVFFFNLNSSTGVSCSSLIFLKNSRYQIVPTTNEKTQSV